MVVVFVLVLAVLAGAMEASSMGVASVMVALSTTPGAMVGSTTILGVMAGAMGVASTTIVNFCYEKLIFLSRYCLVAFRVGKALIKNALSIELSETAEYLKLTESEYPAANGRGISYFAE